jgi:hypothetical protein
MNKPRIKKVNPKWWQCSGFNKIGFGKTPAHSYYECTKGISLDNLRKLKVKLIEPPA